MCLLPRGRSSRDTRSRAPGWCGPPARWLWLGCLRRPLSEFAGAVTRTRTSTPTAPIKHHHGPPGPPVPWPVLAGVAVEGHHGRVDFGILARPDGASPGQREALHAGTVGSGHTVLGLWQHGDAEGVAGPHRPPPKLPGHLDRPGDPAVPDREHPQVLRVAARRVIGQPAYVGNPWPAAGHLHDVRRVAGVWGDPDQR